MQNQTPAAIKNLTSPNSPPYFKGGLGGIISRLGNVFLVCFIVSIIALSFSFVGFLVPLLREIIFFIILAGVLVLSLYRFEYGLYIALAELVLGSKGYLFYSNFFGIDVSLRIGIFLVIFGVFLTKIILGKIKFIWNGWLVWTLPFFVVIIIGFFHGLLRNYGFQNVFLDANGYFYLFYLFPFLSAFRDEEKIQKIKDIIISSGIVLACFSLFLFYIFSHQLFNADLVYKWLRDSLLFEITFTGSVYRIFAQSQILLFVVFFLCLNYFVSVLVNHHFQKEREKEDKFYLAVIASFFSVSGILVSLSRSFFVGLVIGLFVFFIIFYLKQKELKFISESQFKNPKKEFLKIILIVILIFAVSVVFLWTIEPKEPSALLERISFIKPSIIKIEPASLTRQEELKPLLFEIIKKPFLGWGFGKTITFQTSDPRALATLPHCLGKISCPFTTYAFEWGYLDLWLKLGLFGVICLLGILYSLFKRCWLKLGRGEMSALWIVGSLAAVLVTNIFSPYLNHPLGLGILVIFLSITDLHGLKTDLHG